MAEQRTVVDRSNSIQEALWQHAKVIVAKDNSMVPTGLFQTLNEMIDDQEKRLAAFRNRVPNVVLLGLFGIAAICWWICGLRKRSGSEAKSTASLHYGVSRLRGHTPDL
jgi:hypothetical protein